MPQTAGPRLGTHKKHISNCNKWCAGSGATVLSVAAMLCAGSGARVLSVAAMLCAGLA